VHLYNNAVVFEVVRRHERNPLPCVKGAMVKPAKPCHVIHEAACPNHGTYLLSLRCPELQTVVLDHKIARVQQRTRTRLLSDGSNAPTASITHSVLGYRE